MTFVLAWSTELRRWYVTVPAEANATYFDADGDDRWTCIVAANDACDRLNNGVARKQVRA